MREPTAGQLRTRIAIKPWQDQAQGFADVAVVDGPPLYRWASVIPVSSATYWGSRQIDTGVTHLIVLRHCEQVSSRHVVEAEGLRYRVMRLKGSVGAKRWTWLECELLGSA
ncbi:MAG: head-tail adaptor protein [Pseudomonadota bacterium]